MTTVYMVSNSGMCTSYLLEMKRFHDFFSLNGWQIVATPEQAEVIFVGTCVAFDAEEQESLDDLRRLRETGKPVVAYGCLSTYSPARLGEVHSGLVITAMNPETVETLLPSDELRVVFEDIPMPSIFRRVEDYRHYDPTRRFVNINFGCYFTCSFCPHKPGIGPMRSRPLDDIARQIRQFKDEDVRVVILTGLETGSYGRDIGTSYPELLRTVLEIGGNFEIRVAQFNPTWAIKYADELLPLMSDPRVTDFQIPMQTTSARLLKLMRRPQQVTEIADILRRLRADNPRCVFRTDLIAGFPTETWDELATTVAFASGLFDEAAVYGFEKKSGVPLEAMNVPYHTAEEIQARTTYAVETLRAAGLVVHSGGQALEGLKAVEGLKQLQHTQKKRRAVQKCETNL